MGGKEARGGFWFQDAMVLLRILDDAVSNLAVSGTGGTAGAPVEVRVEAAAGDLAAAVAAGAPLWDSTYTRGSEVIVDESKSSDLSRPERHAFYRRIRATVATRGLVASLQPRLTIARDGLTNPEKWKALGAEAQVVEPAMPTGPVSTAKALAAEALYYLTEPGAFPAPSHEPLALADARSLLARFTLDDSRTSDEVEAALDAVLRAIGADWAVEQVVNELRGWIDKAARESGRVVSLTARTLLDEVALASKFLAVERSTQELWRRLREARPQVPPSTIPQQSWRDVQPEAVTRATHARTVVTAAGGAGKSHLLAQLHEESKCHRVWLDAQAIDGVEEALSFGAWACGRRGEELAIFVDGLDAAASQVKVLAVIARAVGTSGVRIWVAARHTTWADIRDACPGWHESSLAPWTIDRVRALADCERTEPLKNDLVELLRTPFLLDVFLRTFPPAERVPEGLATRHGVLRE